jgi:hypothetical protein
LSFEDVVDSVTVELEKRLRGLNKEQLLELLLEVSREKESGDLISLLADYVHFSASEIVEASTRLNREVVEGLLDEPEDERGLKDTVADWLGNQGYTVVFEVTQPNNGRRRPIDLVGVLAEECISAVLVSRATVKEVEDAFSTATEYGGFSHYVYVALSPYSYVANADEVSSLLEEHLDVGVLVVDESRIISRLREANRGDPNEEDLRGLILNVEEKQGGEGSSDPLT